jgi:hypothetical protein
MKKEWRRLWLLSAAVGLIGFIIGAMTSPPVIVDTFHAEHPPTFWDVQIPNLAVIIPYGLVPALLVLLVGWGFEKARNFIQAARNAETLKP